jgi:cell division protein FtsB
LQTESKGTILYIIMPIKKIVFFSIIIASCFIINNFVHSIYTLWTKRDLVEKAKFDLESEKKQNQELKKKLTVVYNQQFVEQEARDKLLMTKPGEGIIVIPTELLHPNTPIVSKPKDTRSNWQKWWQVFVLH